jgi:KDO2-lipid IV(A) lauroyltransferase
LSRIVSAIVAWRRPEVYWTVRANLRHVLGPEAGEKTLHETARHVFWHAGKCYYDLYHTLDRPLCAYQEMARVSMPFLEAVKSALSSGQGVLLLGLHVSNFDLGALALRAHGLPMLVLSLADPQGGARFQNHLREEKGIEITPITPESLRMAIRRLREGGLVVTGVDRPIPQDQELIEFFGQPAYMPLGPARLALMGDAISYVGGCHYEPGAGYALQFTGPIETVRGGSRRQDVLVNARRLAAVAEEYVRAYPEQWLMFYPVWPESSAL